MEPAGKPSAAAPPGSSASREALHDHVLGTLQRIKESERAPTRAEDVAVAINHQLRARITELEASNASLTQKLQEQTQRGDTFEAYYTQNPDLLVRQQDALISKVALCMGVVSSKVLERLRELTIPGTVDHAFLSLTAQQDSEIFSEGNKALENCRAELKKVQDAVKGKVKRMAELEESNVHISQDLSKMESQLLYWQQLVYVPLAIEKLRKEITNLAKVVAPFVEKPSTVSAEKLEQFKNQLDFCKKGIKELVNPKEATPSALFQFFSSGSDKTTQEMVSEQFRIAWEEMAFAYQERWTEVYKQFIHVGVELKLISDEVTICQELTKLQGEHSTFRGELRTARHNFKGNTRSNGNSNPLLNNLSNIDVLKTTTEQQKITALSILGRWLNTITNYYNRIQEVTNLMNSGNLPEEWTKDAASLPQNIRETLLKALKPIKENHAIKYTSHKKRLEDVHKEFNVSPLRVTIICLDWALHASTRGAFRSYTWFWLSRQAPVITGGGYGEMEQLYVGYESRIKGYKVAIPTLQDAWVQSQFEGEEDKDQPEKRE